MLSRSREVAVVEVALRVVRLVVHALLLGDLKVVVDRRAAILTAVVRVDVLCVGVHRLEAAAPQLLGVQPVPKRAVVGRPGSTRAHLALVADRHRVRRQVDAGRQ